MGFAGVDYYEVDRLFADEERMVRDEVRSFVDEHILPDIAGHFRAGTFPEDKIGLMGELGLFGGNLEGYGCAGLNNVAYGLVMQELERGDSGVRSFVSVQGALCMYPIHAFGSEEQRERYLPRMATGEVIGCFGLTEPDFGSHPGGMLTRARKTDGGWVLNGNKMWITNGSMAHIAVVWAKTDDPDSGSGPPVIRGFVVPTDSPGFTARSIPGKFSLRASDTSELIMEDCRVGDDALLPGTTGLKNALMCLNQARYGIAWGAVGAAMACYDEAREYALTRIQFDKPIASFQLVQNKLVGMLTEIVKAQLLVLQLGRLKDDGRLRHQQVSLAKRNNVWEALKTARIARDILGASGITDEYQCGRHLCNLESVYTYEGTHDIHALIIGADVTGIEAFV